MLLLTNNFASAAGTPCSITPVLTEADLNTCIAEAPTDNSEFTITLGASFSVSTIKNIPAGTNITIDSNITGGITVSLQTGNTARHFNVQGGGQLTLASGVTLQGNGGGSGVAGGGVYITSGGTFIMNGGIIDNVRRPTTENPGGVNANGTFIMNSGTISNCTGVAGGGVAVYTDGVFTMNGGTISGNTASSGGAGIYIGNSSTFTMTGGLVSGNVSTTDGGGVRISSGTTFNMSGGTISGNTASSAGGGGVVIGNYGTLTMTGGTISGNTATGGGGIAVYSNSTFTMSDGQINSNSSIGGGGGIYIAPTGTSVIITGGQIINNIAASLGGGIYTSNYNNLAVGANASFSGNSAATYARMNPADQALYDAQIAATSFSLPLPFNGYNNYDIRYESDLPTDICQHNASLWADDANCVATPNTGLFGSQTSSLATSTLSLIASAIAIAAIWAHHKLTAKRR